MYITPPISANMQSTSPDISASMLPPPDIGSAEYSLPAER